MSACVSSPGASCTSRPGHSAFTTANVAFGSWPCKNSNARRARRNILEKLRVMRIDDSADMRLDAVLENCIFYIFPMYEFLHSLGQTQPWRPFLPTAAIPLKPDMDRRGWHGRKVPLPTG